MTYFCQYQMISHWRCSVERIGLAETIEAVRAELASAITAGAASTLQFPVNGVQLEFNVAVEKKAGGKAGVRFWIVELGGSADYRNEEIQKVTVTLGTPVDDHGRPVKVQRGSDEKP
ncbi:trypco2 family protein [Streptomyces tanashiensis]|uniref:trypco2 family protein n=1 Tax=Streptomyces tanashiensis TaxID=67367 RepID=UPI0033C4BE40